MWRHQQNVNRLSETGVDVFRSPFYRHYLPKFTFWQVCWFNGLSVFLSVCPFLYKITDNSRTLWDTFTKISPQMYLGCSSMLFLFKVKGQGHEVTAKVKTRNRCNSVNFWATAKFKNHNVVLLKAHLYDIINFRYHFRFKRSPEVENRKCEIAISIFSQFST